MLKQSVYALCVSLVIGAGSVAEARDASIRGVITKVTANAVEIKTENCEIETVILSERTRFMRSGTGGPLAAWPAKVPQWGQPVRVEARAINVGARVRVEVDPGTSPTARTVWIASSGAR